LIPAHADATGLRQVRLTLADRTNAPVTGGVVRVEAFANADATRRVTAVATAAAEPGVYVLAIPLKRPGKWEFRLIAQRGSDTFTSTQSVDVPHAETASDAIND
jgi:hypothetical protein